MNSFTKDIINKSNISKSRFIKKKSNGKSLGKKDYYIYRFQLFGVAAMFYKIAGGVGAKIYEYLKFKDQFGKDYWVLPNNLFYTQWGIRRQRINDALKKLEKENLVHIIKEKGFNHKVKLNIQEESDEK